MMGVNFDAEAQLGGLLNKVTGGSKADKKKQSINLMAVRIFLQTKDSICCAPRLFYVVLQSLNISNNMTQLADIKYFEGQQIRTVWDADEEKYYYSVVDVVQVLTAQDDYQIARNYWKVLKNRLSKTVTNWLQIVTG